MMVEGEATLPIRCRLCRFTLFPKGSVVNSHGEDIFRSGSDSDDHQTSPIMPMPSCTTTAPAVWYIPEERMPDWMKCNLDKGDWLKGKLHCPSCEARLGSYNFVSGDKCTCNIHLLPPVRIVKSKVDAIIPITFISNSNT